MEYLHYTFYVWSLESYFQSLQELLMHHGFIFFAEHYDFEKYKNIANNIFASLIPSGNMM